MYTQITAAESYILARLRQHHVPMAAIARLLGRHRSTLYREVRRNATHCDGGYRAELADASARTRRADFRRNQRFAPADWAQVYTQLRELWSPEPIAGRFRHECRLRISQELR
jgi:transposase, IS30 family